MQFSSSFLALSRKYPDILGVALTALRLGEFLALHFEKGALCCDLSALGSHR